MPSFDRDQTSGALFVNNRKQQQNHPDFRGELTISKAVLKELVEKAKAGEDIKLAIAGWNKTSKAGTDYVSLAGSIPREYEPSRSSSRRSRDDDGDIPF